jgi:hypothetical protein
MAFYIRHIIYKVSSAPQILPPTEPFNGSLTDVERLLYSVPANYCRHQASDFKEKLGAWSVMSHIKILKY